MNFMNFCPCVHSSSFFSVEFKIGSDRVTLHEPLTITSSSNPNQCLSSITSSSASQGVAVFSNVQFSGFVGWCTFQFVAYFNGVGNPSANSGAAPSEQRRLIASDIAIITPLPSTSLVGGSSYFFSGKFTFMQAHFMSISQLWQLVSKLVPT